MTNTANSLSLAQKWSGRLGWGLILVISSFLFLLPMQTTPGSISPEVWLLVMMALLLLTWLGLGVGAALLLVRYLPFFQQLRGTLLFLLLFVVGLRLFTTLQGHMESALLSRVFLVVAVWLLTLPIILGMALCIYMWFRDQTVRLIAITFLAIPWLFVLYVRNQGAEKLLQNTMQATLPGELFALICFGELIFVLAPLFFIGHSLRLLYREFLQPPADTGKPTPSSPTPQEEIT